MRQHPSKDVLVIDDAYNGKAYRIELSGSAKMLEAEAIRRAREEIRRVGEVPPVVIVWSTGRVEFNRGQDA